MGPAGDADGVGQLGGFVRHQHDVGGLNRRVRTDSAHGDADVRAGEDRRVVDSVPDEHDFAARRGLAGKFLQLFDLLRGEQLRTRGVKPRFARDPVRGPAAVAGQHHRAPDPGLFELLHGLGGVRLDFVGYHDAPRVGAVHGQEDRGARGGGSRVFHARQRGVPREHGPAVHTGPHALAGNHLVARDPRGVRPAAAGRADGGGDRVGGVQLGVRREVQQGFPVPAFRWGDLRDLETPARERAGLVEHDGVHTAEGFQIISAFHQNPPPGSAPDSAEKAERDGKHQRAGARDHQKNQRAVHPFRKRGAGDQQRREECQRHGRKDHGGRVVPGEFRDEILGARLAAARVPDEVEDFAGGRFAEFLRDLHREGTVQVDGAGEHLAARLRTAREGFPRQGGGVQRRAALRDPAVQRDFFAGPHQDGIAHGDFFGPDPADRPARFQVGGIGPDVHQGGNGSFGAVHGPVLEIFPDPVKNHNRRALGVFADRKGAENRDAHQKILVEHVAVHAAARRRNQDLTTGQQRTCEEQRGFHPARRRKRQAGREQRGRQNQRRPAQLCPAGNAGSFPGGGSRVRLPQHNAGAVLPDDPPGLLRHRFRLGALFQFQRQGLRGEIHACRRNAVQAAHLALDFGRAAPAAQPLEEVSLFQRRHLPHSSLYVCLNIVQLNN